jgi:hypothetical protein
MIGAPPLWAIVAALAHRNDGRRVVIVILVLHYITAAWLALYHSFWDQSDMLDKILALQTVLAVWMFTYIAGQVVLWRWLRRRDEVKGRS